tara:strand:- start:204 stop:389 length:186 start_codon:yes stop_codon:yes gene_type:complete
MISRDDGPKDYIIARAEVNDIRGQRAVVVYTPKRARSDTDMLCKYIQAAADKLKILLTEGE